VLSVGLERLGDLVVERVERLQSNPAAWQAPGGCLHAPGGHGPSVGQRDRVEDAVLGDDRRVVAEHRLPVDPAHQQLVEPAQQAGRRHRGRLVRTTAAGQVEQFVAVSAGPAKSAPGVAEGDAGPLGQVAVGRRPVARQVAAGKLCERLVAVDRSGGGQPVADQHEGLVPADHRSPHAHARQGGLEQDVDQRLTGCRDAGRVEGQLELRARRRPVAELALHDDHAPVSLLRRHPLLSEPPRVARLQLRGREGVEPRVVLRPDQVQRASVDPGDDELAPVERCVDVVGA